jgi:hypothetical protein
MQEDKNFFEIIQYILLEKVEVNSNSDLRYKIEMAIGREKKRLNRVEITALLNGAARGLRHALQIKENDANGAYREVVRAHTNIEVALPLMKSSMTR